MATVARIAQIARILADEQIGGNTLERLTIRIAETEPITVRPEPEPDNTPLADWEKELLAGTPEQWCAMFIDNYTDDRANFGSYDKSKVKMVKDVRDKFQIRLAEAVDAVNQAQNDKALTALRNRLTS